MDGSCSAQVTFIFSGLLGQDVTFEGLAALNGSTWTNAEALFRPAFGLHFWHVSALSSYELMRCDAMNLRPLLTLSFNLG
jgi:hypothetical protein